MPRINTEYREDAKRKIIAAAIGIAAEKGWDAVTLEAIAKSVGVTKGALYAYFENSEALLREVLLEVFRNIRIGLEETLEGEEDLHRTVRALGELVFVQQRPYSSIFCQLPVRLPQDPEYRQEFIRIFNGNVALIGNFLSRMQKKGKLPRNVDPGTAANSLIALTMGLRIRSLFLGMDDIAAKEIWIDTVDRILGLRGESPG